MITPRKAVLDLEAYRPPLEGRRNKVRLDFNENTSGFPWAAPGLPAEVVNAYPEYRELLEPLSAHLGLPEESLLLTNGSDEALFVTAFTFIEPRQDAAVISSPTFALIPHYLRLVEAELREIPVLDSLDFDLGGIEAALAQKPKLAIFASPDNPTGGVIPPETVEDWCRRFPETLFAIDEAYAEYAGQSVLPLVPKFQNLLVTRTFSKAWGMAGLRLGVVTGPPRLIEYMRRVRSPYSVNALAVETARRLLERSEDIHITSRATMDLKAKLVSDIEARGYRVRSGSANFLLVSAGWESQTLCDFCEQRGVLVRNRSGMAGMWGLVRVSVGTEAENARFLECLDAFRQTRALIFDMDDTLVDTSRSFDVTVMNLVERYSGENVPREVILALRAEGGFNDDWDATQELLRRRGKDVSREEIEREGKALYLSLAKENETFLLNAELLKRLGGRFRLMIVTGRTRDEYEPIWREYMEPLFERVYCRDDFPSLRPKPAPDTILAAMKDTGVSGGYYVGNSVDDMTAAQGAGLSRIGVTSTHSATLLTHAGAEQILTVIDEIEKVFFP